MQADIRDGDTIAVVPETVAEQVIIEAFCEGAYLTIEPPAPFEANMFKLVIRRGTPSEAEIKPKKKGKK